MLGLRACGPALSHNLNLPLGQEANCKDMSPPRPPDSHLPILCFTDSSHGSHGTHVNVTCIVNVCSSSDHSSQCSSQTSTTVGDPDAHPSGSPKDEQVPFSQEECPSQSQWETPETPLSHEKPWPLGVPDVGMKPNQQGWCDQVAAKVA